MTFALIAGLQRLDPDGRGRIKGLRLVAAYGIASTLGAMHGVTMSAHMSSAMLAVLAGNFALWASVSEARDAPRAACRDLAVLCAGAGLGALAYILIMPLLAPIARAGAELTLVTGAFLVGYLKRYGVLGAGLGSQIYIGELLAYSAKLDHASIPAVGIAVMIAMAAAILPRVLTGRAERSGSIAALSPAHVPDRWPLQPETIMGVQAATAALVVVALNDAFSLTESAWAITACTYVVAGSATGTVDRVRRRIVGTLIGVPLGLACLPLAVHAPIILWATAALAMILYAMALPTRYDIACGAFAFTLIVTLAASGEHSVALLAARAWETLLGGGLGLAAALWILPLRGAAKPTT
jgi:uncharacterized membrane protein YccC